MHVTLRRGTPADAHAVADLWIRARRAATDIPATIRTDDEIRGWIAARVLPDTIDQLYVEPTLTRRGVGSELLRIAMSQRPDGKRLWTFER